MNDKFRNVCWMAQHTIIRILLNHKDEAQNLVRSAIEYLIRGGVINVYST